MSYHSEPTTAAETAAKVTWLMRMRYRTDTARSAVNGIFFRRFLNPVPNFGHHVLRRASKVDLAVAS